MSTLATLKLSASKKSQAVNPAVHRRNKLGKKIWEQIELAKAQSTGNSFTTTRFRTIQDDHGIRSGSAKLNRSDKCIIGVFSLGKGAGAGDLYEQIIWAANAPRV